MLVPYLRSSLIGNWKLCQLQTLLTYVFGMDNKAGAAASGGTCVHKMFELRALASINEKRGVYEFEYDDWGIIKTEWAKDFDQTIDKVYSNQQKVDSHVKWDKMPKSKVLEWAKKTISDCPKYDPVNLNIVQVEQYFDIEIKEDWAKYKEVVNGKTYEGYMRIKGTIDCIIDLGNDVYECYDLKSGKRACFATGEEKTLDYLSKDHQLLFYLYALKQIYPDKHFIMSLYFINDGGIYSVVGDDKMFDKAKNMIKENYQKITTCKAPTVLDKYRGDFRCKYCCAYSKPASFTGDLSVCEFMQKEIKKEGMKKTIDKYADMGKFNYYGSGGGRVKDE
jgi:hypothetical protein